MVPVTNFDPKKFAALKFDNADCIVVKIGSALLVDLKTNSLRLDWLRSVASDINNLKLRGKRVVIVSSGSIALGRNLLQLSGKSLNLEESQAAAAVGQISLAQSYQKCLEKYGIKSGQILVTSEDSQSRRRYLNSRATLLKLLEMGVVPIVNENDTVATDEIKFGDNDRLAAQVASLCDANILVLMSDVDGFYTADPHLDRTASRLPVVNKITDEIERMAKGNVNSLSKGGMRTKIDAAKLAVSAGCHLVIANGNKKSPLMSLLAGGPSTWFVSSEDPIAARKQWIANTKAKGEVLVDKGAEKALLAGKSLLPAGVVDVKGLFARGDTVLILSNTGNLLGRGLVAYNNSEVLLIKGCHSSKIKSILGHPGRTALIHRNDMAF